ncbi:hypothetical protein KP509_03G001900 [Ceratopteris richardii]|nr:hypothetical protein KP509_03G001900 [Ceratopteris richardii]
MQLAQKFKQFHLNVVPLNENRHALMLAREVCYFRNAPETEKVMKVPEMKGYCPICMEWKKKVEMFEVSQCHHGFCLSCIIQHVEVKVQAAQVPVQCPQENCSQTLSLSQCQSFLSQKWFDLLKKRIIEASMPESERVYCPRPKCSALMHRKDLLASREGTSSLSSFTFVAPSKCVECSGLFCIDCLVPWHAFMSCEQYQRLPMFFRGSEDILLYKLAEKQKWQRCGNCRQMIELKDGCYHITCWCGHEFCYLCGKAWKSKKQTCQCRLWDEDFLFEEPLDQSEDEEHDEWEGSVGSEDDSEDEHDQVAESEDESEYWEDLSDLNTRVRFEVPASFYNPYYKTKLCWHWETGCPWGDYCKFAHGTKELRRVNFFQPIF